MKRNKNNKTTEERKIHTVKNFFMAFRLTLKIYPEKLILSLIADPLRTVQQFFLYTYLLNYVVNGLQLGKPISNLLTYVAVMSVIGIVIDILIKLYYQYLMVIINKRSEIRINKIMFRRFVDSDLANYEDPTMYDLFGRVLSGGVGSIDWVTDAVPWLLSMITQFSLSSWLVLKIDPMLFVFALIPLAFNLLRKKRGKIRHQYDIADTAIRRRRDYTQRVFYEKDFAKEMRLTNIHKVMLRSFRKAIDDYQHLVRTLGVKEALLNLLTNFGIDILAVGGAQIYIIYRALVSNSVLIGDCLVVMSTITGISHMLASIGGCYSYLHGIGYKFQDYRDYMERKDVVTMNQDGPRADRSGNIELRNVSFRYNGAAEDTLHDISVTIHEGEKIAIVGYNGAGKTTLVKLLMRLYDPTQGEINYAGRNITEYELRSYRDRYGVVLQDYKQIAMSVAENVLNRPYCDEDEQTVIDALRRAGIWEKIEKLPKGIHTSMTREFDDDGLLLSGGESQKLAIASVYAKDCSVVILDEPSSALDPLAEHDMYEQMYRACESKTMIFISHRLSSAVSADRILLMEDGRITEQGSHAELMRRGGKYAEMFTVQAENYK